jgi:hypothetical protein
MRVGDHVLTPDVEWSACDCIEFLWNGELAAPGEEICACGHPGEEHLPSGECGFGVLE